MEKRILADYIFSDDKSRLQVEKVHSLLEHAYWSKGIPIETVKKAIDGSICFAIYAAEGDLVACARVTTDLATFGWLSDVIVDPNYRGKGLSKELMREILGDPRFKGLRRFALATKDAHELYKQFGFKVTETPGNWMEIKNNDIYLVNER